MEASVLVLQEFLQRKVMKSDEKSELLFGKMASDMALEGFSFEVRQFRALAQLQLLVPALCNILWCPKLLGKIIYSLFNEIESRFSLQCLEELWSMIHQQSSKRKKWIRAVDESLKEIERSRAIKVSCSLNVT